MKKENEQKKSTTSWSAVKWDAAVVAVSGFALLANVCGWNPWGWSRRLRSAKRSRRAKSLSL